MLSMSYENYSVIVKCTLVFFIKNGMREYCAAKTAVVKVVHCVETNGFDFSV